MSEFTVRRVVIACDSACENRLAIETAARLAAHWDAALEGIFVEDLDLLEAAGLPFTRQVSLGTGRAEEFDRSQIESQFVALAERARRALESAAAELGVSWTFAVKRSAPSIAAISHEEGDLLVIESASRPFTSQFQLASRWIAAAFEDRRSVLVVRGDGARRHGVVAVVQAPGASAQRVLSAAVQLAEQGALPLTVFLAGAPGEEEVRGLVAKISPKLSGRTRIMLAPAGLDALVRGIGEAGGDILVIDADPKLNDAKALKDLMARVSADVLLMR